MYWILNGKTPIKVEEVKEWAQWFEANSRKVDVTKIAGVVISTIFLGLDFNFSEDGPPILFETEIFGGRHDQQMVRYTTWDIAEEGHKRMVEMVINSMAPQN